MKYNVNSRQNENQGYEKEFCVIFRQFGRSKSIIYRLITISKSGVRSISVEISSSGTGMFMSACILE